MRALRAGAFLTATASALVLVTAPTAGAATIIGQAPPTAGNPGNCSVMINNSSLAQRSTSNVGGGPGYTIPSAGVITEWRHFANGTAGQTLRLRVFRAGSFGILTAVAESEGEVLTPSVVNTFPTRIRVEGGELIGVLTGPAGMGGSSCVYIGGGLAAMDQVAYGGDNFAPPVGEPATYPSNLNNFRLNVAAVLEPDADNDGFGDETQDCNSGNAAQATDCAPPDTQITKGPKAKTKKKQATFEFSGNDARTIAGFECSLDGGAFASCTSPHTVKVKRGKHTFSVRAVDAGGNADGTPATDDWKVKKSKKK